MSTNYTLRRTRTLEEVMAVFDYLEDEGPETPEVIAIIEELETCNEIEFVRILNLNPEFRETTFRRISAETLQQVKTKFPGAALLAFAGTSEIEQACKMPPLSPKEYDAEIAIFTAVAEELVTTTRGLRVINLIKAFDLLTPKQQQRVINKNPLAAFLIASDYMEPLVYRSTFLRLRDQLHALQTSKERSRLFLVFEDALNSGMPKKIVFGKG